KLKGKKKVTGGIGVENQVVVGKYPIIFNRCSPKQLFNAIRKLGSQQKQVVEGVPQRMSFYVVDMFDEVYMEIRVPCGNIKVDEESLHNLLGVPKDGVDLLSRDAKKVWTLGVTGWRKKYDKDYITPSNIVSRIIKNYDDVSLNFQLDFLVLFISPMVECYAHGKCKLDVLDYLMTLIRLKDCKRGWERQATSPFKGGLTILTDLDRLKGREHVEVASSRFGDGHNVEMKGYDTGRKIEAGIGLKPNEMPSYSLGLTQEWEEIKKPNTISGEGVEDDVRIDVISLNGDETVEVLLDQKEANVFNCKGEPADVTAKTFDLKG
ncbi:hypothetical protein R6Q59_018869, partial [Mikania micrantha]